MSLASLGLSPLSEVKILSNQTLIARPVIAVDLCRSKHDMNGNVFLSQFQIITGYILKINSQNINMNLMACTDNHFIQEAVRIKSLFYGPGHGDRVGLGTCCLV